MNIISNNCLGGFLYRDLLKTEYKSPFIWTLMEPDLYIEFIDNFENINFDNFELTNDSKELSNKFSIIIDEKYKLEFIHAHFDKSSNKPKIVNADVYYCKIWEYIVEVYTRRLERMKHETDKLFLFHEPNLPYKNLNKLPEICEKHKYKCLIFANDDDVIENDYCKKFSIDKKWPTYQPLIEKYKKVFIDYLCK